MMCEPGRNQTQGELMSSVEGSRVKTFPSLDTWLESTESEADCGASSRESFAFYDRDSSLLRTSQRCLWGGLCEFSQTLPKSGYMLNGRLFQRAPLVCHTHASDCSLLLTPTAQQYRAWTFRNPYSLIRKNHADGNLQERLMRVYQRMLTSECAEIMMGFPQSWTDLNHSATPSSPKSPNGSGDES